MQNYPSLPKPLELPNSVDIDTVEKIRHIVQETRMNGIYHQGNDYKEFRVDMWSKIQTKVNNLVGSINRVRGNVQGTPPNKAAQEVYDEGKISRDSLLQIATPQEKIGLGRSNSFK
jgi:hypothetical protein